MSRQNHSNKFDAFCRIFVRTEFWGMQKLNLPYYDHRIKNNENRQEIFDPCRKKYVALTPEEWVRQNFLQYLLRDLGYPAGRTAVEMSLQVGKMKKRADIVVFDPFGAPYLVVECKAPQVEITQGVFDQIARYNLSLGVSFLVVTNGLKHVCCSMDKESRKYVFYSRIPVYGEEREKEG